MFRGDADTLSRVRLCMCDGACVYVCVCVCIFSVGCEKQPAAMLSFLELITTRMRGNSLSFLFPSLCTRGKLNAVYTVTSTNIHRAFKINQVCDLSYQLEDSRPDIEDYILKQKKKKKRNASTGFATSTENTFTFWVSFIWQNTISFTA